MLLNGSGLARMTFLVLLSCAVLCCASCGFIADKDLIKIAKIQDKYITRGDLAKVIRDTPDDERPIIRNKGDLLRVLNDYIDELIKTPLSQDIEQKLEAEGKTLVDRKAAMQKYFSEHSEDNYAEMYAAENGEAIGMNSIQLNAIKQQIDLAIDRVLEKMRGDAAVMLRAVEELKKGSLTITDEEFQREYALRKDELKKFEWMKFRALRFRTDMENAEGEAATVRKRLDAGESFDKLVEEYEARNKDFVLTSEIENNPGLARFQQFWSNASGAQKGDVMGPVFLPEYQIMSNPDSQGKASVVNMPAAYLVLQVQDVLPETTLSLDESKGRIAPSIVVSKMMAQLRQEAGVEIYEKNLPDPGVFSGRSNDDPFGVKN
jgi:hypothetical protein